MSHHALKLRARLLYKELHRLGRDYPDEAYGFNRRLRKCFADSVIEDEAELESAVKKAEFVKKEVEALYMLKKYRAMKRNYPDMDDQ